MSCPQRKRCCADRLRRALGRAGSWNCLVHAHIYSAHIANRAVIAETPSLSRTTTPDSPTRRTPPTASFLGELILLHSRGAVMAHVPPAAFCVCPSSSRYSMWPTSLATANCAMSTSLTVNCPPRLPRLTRGLRGVHDDLHGRAAPAAVNARPPRGSR